MCFQVKVARLWNKSTQRKHVKRLKNDERWHYWWPLIPSLSARLFGLQSMQLYTITRTLIEYQDRSTRCSCFFFRFAMNSYFVNFIMHKRFEIRENVKNYPLGLTPPQGNSSVSWTNGFLLHVHPCLSLCWRTISKRHCRLEMVWRWKSELFPRDGTLINLETPRLITALVMPK